MATVRAKPRFFAASEFDSAPFAFCKRSLNIHIPTFARTIFDFPRNRPAGIKLVAAVGALARATRIANLGSCRLRTKFVSTFSALNRWQATRIPSLANEIGVRFPKCSVGFRVTTEAKRNQIFQPVGLFVGRKQVEWFDVVNMQSLIIASAMLTFSLVALQSRSTLPFPVPASIFNVPALPRRTISARPFVRRPPQSKALSVAEIERIQCRRVLLNGAAALVALDDYAFAPDANPVRFLPLAVTSKSAKMIFRLLRHIRLSLVDAVALVTF